jgi:hypothetical protein
VFMVPPYGIDSPVVDHLLKSWTNDTERVIVFAMIVFAYNTLTCFYFILKIKYLLSWVECLSSPLPSDFPVALRLTELTSIIRYLKYSLYALY